LCTQIIEFRKFPLSQEKFDDLRELKEGDDDFGFLIWDESTKTFDIDFQRDDGYTMKYSYND
jgi:hypothetical protein